MTDHFTESQFLSRRLIAAAGIPRLQNAGLSSSCPSLVAPIRTLLTASRLSSWP
jgi:hypothetical protein